MNKLLFSLLISLVSVSVCAGGGGNETRSYRTHCSSYGLNFRTIIKTSRIQPEISTGMGSVILDNKKPIKAVVIEDNESYFRVVAEDSSIDIFIYKKSDSYPSGAMLIKRGDDTIYSTSVSCY